MRVQQYLDELVEKLNDAFRDKGRQMSMADVGTIYCTFSAYAREHKDLPLLPYEAENQQGQ